MVTRKELLENTRDFFTGEFEKAREKGYVTPPSIGSVGDGKSLVAWEDWDGMFHLGVKDDGDTTYEILTMSADDLSDSCKLDQKNTLACFANSLAFATEFDTALWMPVLERELRRSKDYLEI